MGNWWKIAKLEITLAARDREAVIWSLVAPVGMAWLFGTMFSDSPPQPTQVLVVPGNNPQYVERIFSGLLETRGFSVSADSSVNLRVVVPDSLVSRLVAGNDDITASIVRSDVSEMRAQSVSAAVREIMYTLAFRARAQWIESPPSEEEIDNLIGSEGPMTIDTRPLGDAPRSTSGMVHQLPAMLVMFLMFQLLTFFMVMWVEDIKTGKIKRIVMSPTPVRDLFLGQLVSRGLWGVLQVVVILGAGSLLLGVRLEVPYLYFGVMLLAYMVTAISLGLLAGTYFRTTEKANAIGVIAGLVMGALGGCWWPLEVVSDTMRTVALVFPTGLMMDATEEFIALGSSAAFPTMNFAILVLMSAVMMPLAVKRMRRQVTS